eukprot:8973119-Heterocapsa_arctica.AAC.1
MARQYGSCWTSASELVSAGCPGIELPTCADTWLLSHRSSANCATSNECDATASMRFLNGSPVLSPSSTA